jgi:hypothetical protein
MYPLLSEFSSAVTQLIASGEKRVVVDLSSVGYLRSYDDEQLSPVDKPREYDERDSAGIVQAPRLASRST